MEEYIFGFSSETKGIHAIFMVYPKLSLCNSTSTKKRKGYLCKSALRTYKTVPYYGSPYGCFQLFLTVTFRPVFFWSTT